MGIRGRAPIPAAMIDNNRSTGYKKSQEEIDERLAMEEKMRTKSVLKCPSHLSKEAKREWHRVIRLYREMEVDILNDLDIQPLAMYCEAVAIYSKAKETWNTYQKVVVANPEAQRVIDKCFSTMEKQTAIVSKLSEQLCITPVGRARMGIHAKVKKGPSKLDSILGDDE